MKSLATHTLTQTKHTCAHTHTCIHTHTDQTHTHTNWVIVIYETCDVNCDYRWSSNESVIVTALYPVNTSSIVLV